VYVPALYFSPFTAGDELAQPAYPLGALYVPPLKPSSVKYGLVCICSNMGSSAEPLLYESVVLATSVPDWPEMVTRRVPTNDITGKPYTGVVGPLELYRLPSKVIVPAKVTDTVLSLDAAVYDTHVDCSAVGG